MISDKEKQIRDSLTDKEYREALAIEHVNTTLAIQIRKMRENNQWTQNELANHLGKYQETISQWENPEYGRYSVTTLKELAAIFDVALLIKFIPFSELIQDMMNLSETRLSPPSYKKEKDYTTGAFTSLASPRKKPSLDITQLTAWNEQNQIEVYYAQKANEAVTQEEEPRVECCV